MSNITINDLYKLFFDKNLIKPTLIEPSSPTKTKKIDINQYELSPSAIAIYESTSPKSKPYILEGLISDKKAIENMEFQAELSDPDYQDKMENNGLGFFMEDYISAHGFCPVCGGKTLCKYLRSNIPVVDLVCTNTDFHLQNDKCFMFQVKISVSNDYFNFDKKILMIGSKKFGIISHIHKGTDDITKKIVMPGYICIKLNKHPTKIQTYIIDQKISFVLVPDYQNNSNEYYYKYLDNSTIYNRFNKNILTWNTNMINTFKLSHILPITTINYEYYSENEIKNPYSPLLSLL